MAQTVAFLVRLQLEMLQSAAMLLQSASEYCVAPGTGKMAVTVAFTLAVPRKLVFGPPSILRRRTIVLQSRSRSRSKGYLGEKKQPLKHNRGYGFATEHAFLHSRFRLTCAAMRASEFTESSWCSQHSITITRGVATRAAEEKLAKLL